ncbi:hypothetical protein CPB86DRAFT_686490, partial [Serendipita vermifera]
AMWAKYHATDWTSKLHPSLKAQPNTVEMVADNVPTTFQIGTDPVKSILRDNPHLPKHSMLSVKWLTNLKNSNKKFGSLLLSFSSKQSAKEAFKEYLMVSKLPCRLRPYVPPPTQCFQCQGFGHYATDCQNPTKCARCAESHPTKQCPCSN